MTASRSLALSKAWRKTSKLFATATPSLMPISAVMPTMASSMICASSCRLRVDSRCGGSMPPARRLKCRTFKRSSCSIDSPQSSPEAYASSIWAKLCTADRYAARAASCSDLEPAEELTSRQILRPQNSYPVVRNGALTASPTAWARGVVETPRLRLGKSQIVTRAGE